jgi:hypothetical protein
MIGDGNDMVRRMRATLPAGWFGDISPNLQAVLSGFGSAFSSCYDLIQYTISQSRILTAISSFLDLVAADFFGSGLARFPGESDTSLRSRILAALLQPRATRSALINVLQRLTGRIPIVFEPARPQDTGSYTHGGAGYCVGGGWGNLELQFQFFVTAFRPTGGGIAQLAGYSVGGIPVYGDLSMVAAQVSDSAILAAVAGIVPTCTIAWTRISS